ncbi:DUF3558 family protein [Streptomyces sp. NPDC058440]|uniref:DUF3558 family protein n=1 Tax=Streptomyces sp. NPDC058440 TaxID=3346501 RepID=UPI003651C63D
MTLTRVHRGSALLSTTLLAVLGLAGCGGSGEKAPAAGTAPSATVSQEGSAPSAPPKKAPADPCALISLQEAQELGGTSVEGQKSEDTAGGCRYTHEGVPIASTIQGDEARQFMDDMLRAADRKPLAGIGDEATAYDDKDHGTFGLLFRKSGTWVAMTVVADRADNDRRLEELARKVAARM